MKKKTIIGLILSLFLISIVTAGISISINEEREVDKDTKDYLDDLAVRKGLEEFPDYIVPSLECSNNSCKEIHIKIDGIDSMYCNILPYKKELELIDEKGGLTEDNLKEVIIQKTDKELKEELIECENAWLKLWAWKEEERQTEENETREIIQEDKEVSLTSEK